MTAEQTHLGSAHTASAPQLQFKYPEVVALQDDIKQRGHAVAGGIQIAAPRIESQPWVLDLQNWFKKHTIGTARVDLRRPVPPSPDQYEGNLLFAHKPVPTGGQFFAGARERYKAEHYPTVASASPPQYPAIGSQSTQFVSDTDKRDTNQPNRIPTLPDPRPLKPPTGARLKITRNLIFGQDPDGGKPLVDLGLGFNLDMDRQKVDPVVRLKFKDFFSIKAVPLGVIKFSRALLLGTSGMAVKVLYECPLQNLDRFWMPPSRLMVRLENHRGSHFQLTPTGVELDEKRIKFGDNLTLQVAGGLTFPRSIPIDRANDDFGWKIHRLSLKSKW